MRSHPSQISGVAASSPHEKIVYTNEGGHGNPLQYSCLEKPMDRGVAATVHGVTKELNTTEV